MPRFRNALTGVVVHVDDEYAARLGSSFTELAEDEAPATDDTEDEAPATKRRPRR